MFSNDPYVHEMYQMLLGDNVHWQDREAWIYSKERLHPLPVPGSAVRPAAGGHQGVHRRRDRSALRAASSRRSPAADSNGPTATCNGHATTATALFEPLMKANGAAQATARLTSRRRAPAQRGHEGNAAANFEEFIYKVWGAGIAKHFAIPYNRKLWAVPLNEMETSWLGGRVPLPDLEEMIEGALSPVAQADGARTPASATRCAAASRR